MLPDVHLPRLSKPHIDKAVAPVWQLPWHQILYALVELPQAERLHPGDPFPTPNVLACAKALVRVAGGAAHHEVLQIPLAAVLPQQPTVGDYELVFHHMNISVQPLGVVLLQTEKLIKL